MAILSTSFELPLRSFVLELTLDIEGTVALIGPSGAGKTSVLNAVAGLVKPSSGRIAARRRRLVRLGQGRLSASRTSGASVSSSRSTRCSRT